jgi:hypothetical protein
LNDSSARGMSPGGRPHTSFMLRIVHAPKIAPAQASPSLACRPARPVA